MPRGRPADPDLPPPHRRRRGKREWALTGVTAPGQAWTKRAIGIRKVIGRYETEAAAREALATIEKRGWADWYEDYRVEGPGQ